MENQNILQVHYSATDHIQQNREELDAGMKILNYEPFDIGFDNDDPSISEILSYKNENKIVVFYNRASALIPMKIFSLDKGLTKTTAVFASIGINDIRTILTMY